MDYDLYLMWVPNTGWGVFDTCSCPDPGAFPGWMYKKYTVTYEKRKVLLDRLMEIKKKLVLDKIVPSKEKDIFPELCDLLSEK